MTAIFDDLDVMSDIMEHAPINIMIANVEEDIVFVNKKARDVLSSVESDIAQYIPGFRASEVVGGSIHRYHKDPEPIKQMLRAMGPGDSRQGVITPGPYLFEHETRPLYNKNGEKLGYIVQWNDETARRHAQDEADRMSSGVEGASNALMMCDENRIITFLNPAAHRLLARREATLRQHLPSFDVNNLVGTTIDVFHRHPAHQQQLLADPSRLPYTGQIKLPGVVLEITATMITNSEGEYRGNMVEWRDITDEIATENAIQDLIEGALRGELTNRLEIPQTEGFTKSLCESINRLMDEIIRPIRDTSTVIKGLAEGNLTNQITTDYEGEFGALKQSVNSSISNLLGMVTEIREVSMNIGTAAGEISAGNTDLSQRTEQQAASLEETASSMEEMTSTVKQNADNVKDASRLADGAREQAEKGGQIVASAVTAMGEINSRSKKIADIIGVIDEIAFQTNILALNAAVEAARAGEQGRGFAVVAAEVRNLAQRSASAAKEIKSLINDSVEKVEEGTRLVSDSGSSLEQIVAAVKRVSEIVAEIAAASEEQSIGIEQVNKAIMQLEQVTQQNAALVEQAAASSEAMSDQSQNLNSLIGFFDTGAGNQAVAARAIGGRTRRAPKSAPSAAPA
ncbi:methyl-accepting chemotaxis protein, partial [Pontibacterium sp.]|uniref:methyl-accepting chemotaxis protein n=1 Tax=Pontibacterium sp. TaxID=2036026 RepID=UPI003515B659